MARDIHDIYDVIMKIIVLVYGPIFLRFIGIEEEIKKVLDVEFTTITGKKFHLDYLCLLEDDTLCNIEFQFPIAKPTDLSRFSKYNILAEARYQKTANTYIINFTEFKQNIKTIKIGKSKSFHPEQIYLGDIPYDEILKKINIKVKSNESLTNEEEIILMISILTPKCKSKFETLKQICEFLEKKELFDATKLEFIKAIISLEINDFLSEEEKHKINKEIKMSPQAEKIVLQAINEVNQKVLYETKMKSLEEGIELGKIEGRKEERIEIAKNLKETMTPEEISKYTGLTTKEIERL